MDDQGYQWLYFYLFGDNGLIPRYLNFYGFPNKQIVLNKKVGRWGNQNKPDKWNLILTT
jgi:hypothetical protein